MAAAKRNCCDAILQYLVSQNRPYGVNDIVQNLHNEYNKTAIQKALDELTADRKVREKIYGKQKVYTCLQVFEDDAFKYDSEIDKLDNRIEEANAKMKSLEQVLKATELELKKIENQPTTQNAIREIHELEKSVRDLRERIIDQPQSKVMFIEEEMSQLKNAQDEVFKEYKKRKRICLDIVHCISENYPKKIKLLLEEIGIEIEDENIL